jgi:hypothetical protein
MDGKRPRHLYHFALSRFSQAALGESWRFAERWDRAEKLAHLHSFRPILRVWEIFKQWELIKPIDGVNAKMGQ